MTPPPSASIIKSTASDGDRFSWIPPRRLGGRIFRILFFVAWLSLWTAVFIPLTGGLVAGLVTGEWRAPVPLLIGLWLMMFVGEVAGLGALIASLLPSIPEKIRLRPHALVHDFGYSATDDSLKAALPWILGRLRGEVREYPKSELSEPRLERIGSRLWLYIDHGRDRIWIGRHLAEPDKEWLHNLLQGWKRG